jgi:hypothetical protein
MNEPTFKDQFVHELSAQSATETDAFADTDKIQMADDGATMWVDESIETAGGIHFPEYIEPDGWTATYTANDMTPVYVFNRGNERIVIDADKVEGIATLDGSTPADLCERATVCGRRRNFPVAFDVRGRGRVVIAPLGNAPTDE